MNGAREKQVIWNRASTHNLPPALKVMVVTEKATGIQEFLHTCRSLPENSVMIRNQPVNESGSMRETATFCFIRISAFRQLATVLAKSTKQGFRNVQIGGTGKAVPQVRIACQLEARQHLHVDGFKQFSTPEG